MSASRTRAGATSRRVAGVG